MSASDSPLLPDSKAWIDDGARLRLIEENVLDYGIVTLDLQGNIVRWSRGAERILGWQEQEVIGQPGAVFFTPEDRASGAVAKELSTAATQGRAEDKRWHLRKDGGRFWANGIMTALRDEGGELRGFVKILRDATERHQAKVEKEALLKTLEVQRTRLTNLFMQAPAFIAVLHGPQHIFEITNPLYDQLIGHRDVLGKSVREALPEVEEQGFVELLDEVYRTGKPFLGNNVRILLQREKDAAMQERFLDFTYQPLVETEGMVSGIFVLGGNPTLLH